jgi:hypothetical protein
MALKDKGPFINGDIPSATFWNALFPMARLTGTVVGSVQTKSIALPTGWVIASTIILAARIKLNGASVWDCLNKTVASDNTNSIKITLAVVGGVDSVVINTGGADLGSASYDVLVAQLS